MERFPVELLYALAIAGFFLFNMLAQRAARRRQQEEQAAQPAQPEPAVEEPLEDIWGRTPAPAPVPAAVVLAAPPPPPSVRTALPPTRRMHPVRALLKHPRDLRRAVVLTMVLGPCRAQEPPDERP